MTDHRVFSGYTEKIDEQRKAWYEQLAGKRLEWEELASAGSTNEVLGKAGNPVPLYQYLVNYLLYVWEKGENREIRYDQMISDLTDRVADAFKKNGMPEEKCAKAHVRDMLTTEWSREWDSFERAASSRVFELGLGLGLPADDVEQLLQKAVRRAGFNYYDPEEMIVYCALKFCKKTITGVHGPCCGITDRLFRCREKKVPRGLEIHRKCGIRCWRCLKAAWRTADSTAQIHMNRER